MYRLLTCAVCGIATLASASLADAQIVRWGPGGVRVRAPFVSVDVSPYGGTRVRAPFTAVDSRVYGGYVYPPGVVVGPVPPIPFPRVAVPAVAVPAVPVYPAPVYPGVVYPEPAAPSTYQSARPTLDGTLPEQLRSAAETLARSLAVRQDGDVWLDYLGPQKIIEAIDLGRSPESLRPLVINYDGVLSNGSLVAIRGARGFAETRELLKLYVEGGSVPSPAPNVAPTSPESGVIARPDGAVRTKPEPTPPQPVEETLPLPAPDGTPEPAPDNGGPQAPVPPPPSPRPPATPTPL